MGWLQGLSNLQKQANYTSGQSGRNCSECGGSGRVECDCTDGVGRHAADDDCPGCGGRGVHTCPACHGTGRD